VNPGRAPRALAWSMLVVGAVLALSAAALAELDELLAGTSLGAAALRSLDDPHLFAIAVVGALLVGVGVALLHQPEVRAPVEVEPAAPDAFEEIARREAEAIARLAEPAPTYALDGHGAAPDDGEIARALALMRWSTRGIGARVWRPVVGFVVAAALHASLVTFAARAAAPTVAEADAEALAYMSATLTGWHDTRLAALEAAAALEESAGPDMYRGRRDAGRVDASTELERFLCLNDLERMWPQDGCGHLFFGAAPRPWHQPDTRRVLRPTKLEDARLRAELGFEPPPCATFDPPEVCASMQSLEDLSGIGEFEAPPLAPKWRPSFPPPLAPGVAHAPVVVVDRVLGDRDPARVARDVRALAGTLRACMTPEGIDGGGTFKFDLLYGVDGGVTSHLTGGTLPAAVEWCMSLALRALRPGDRGARVATVGAHVVAPGHRP
jgi:hypothetical protein